MKNVENKNEELWIILTDRVFNLSNKIPSPSNHDSTIQSTNSSTAKDSIRSVSRYPSYMAKQDSRVYFIPSRVAAGVALIPSLSRTQSLFHFHQGQSIMPGKKQCPVTSGKTHGRLIIVSVFIDVPRAEIWKPWRRVIFHSLLSRIPRLSTPPCGTSPNWN